ncbi:MAG TPA: hypothetical protein VKZ67_13945 [Natronosporangium sp.]|nr:hypothetical protein [Natronosporangium sp.]
MSHQIRAHFGTIETLAADQGALAGNVESIRLALRQHAQQALQTLDGGMGAEEHQACMDHVDRLIDEYIQSTQNMQRTTTQVGDTFLAGGQRARSVLGSGT